MLIKIKMTPSFERCWRSDPMVPIEGGDDEGVHDKKSTKKKRRIKTGPLLFRKYATLAFRAYVHILMISLGGFLFISFRLGAKWLALQETLLVISQKRGRDVLTSDHTNQRGGGSRRLGRKTLYHMEGATVASTSTTLFLFFYVFILLPLSITLRIYYLHTYPHSLLFFFLFIPPSLMRIFRTYLSTPYRERSLSWDRSVGVCGWDGAWEDKKVPGHRLSHLFYIRLLRGR